MGVIKGKGVIIEENASEGTREAQVEEINQIHKTS
jgi:hypothetical protein